MRCERHQVIADFAASGPSLNTMQLSRQKTEAETQVNMHTMLNRADRASHGEETYHSASDVMMSPVTGTEA